MADVLDELAAVLESRKSADAGGSYVASLYAGGTPAILAKVEEEAGEVVAAGRSGTDDEVVHEVADLWFHTLVLLAHRRLGPGRVLDELRRRFGRSGLDEKAGRLRK
ncbi:MAG TPA: phosphoribosyl-ATP diphosphatase [Gammaproteobacteria bacterium]|jgi:phosphoribosyl-ATP pyrophosphohydrolase